MEVSILFQVAGSLSCAPEMVLSDLLEANSSFVEVGMRPYGLECVYFYEVEEEADTLC